MSEFIYLDYNATTPIDPRVAAAMVPALKELFGNPSSGHKLGLAARAALEKARAQVAGLLGCDPDEILFTSGGSESNNTAILGLAEIAPAGERHVISSLVEHPATVEPCRWLERRGWRVTWLPVDGAGFIDPRDLEATLCPETALVSLMLANNEVGTVQPIAECARLCRERGVPMHSDAAQAVGKIPVDARALGVDFLSLAGHKLYAPKGIGALYIRAGRSLAPFVKGAGQEDGRRAGTENILEIVGLGAAAEIASRELEADMAHSLALRDRLHAGLRERFPADRLRINSPLGVTGSGAAPACLPGTLSVSFRGISAGDLLQELGDRLAASAGAACNKDGSKVSAVLTAMGIPLEWARGTLRLSVGRMSRQDEIDRALDLLSGALEKLASA